MSAKPKLAPKAEADIALVVFGIDRAKKHHASRFGSAAAQSAQDAAQAMGMRTIRVVSDEQREIARRLPKGSVSPKGRAVIPLVRPALFNKLLAVAGSESAPPTPTNQLPPASDKMSEVPTDNKPDSSGGWTGLIRGSVVLATDDPDTGWFECIVQHVDGETLTLIWKGWPELGKLNRKLTQVALLNPKMVKPC